MRRKTRKKETVPRRVFTREFKEEAVRMLLDGHSTRSVCERLGLPGVNLLYRWKKEFLGKESGVASNLEQRVRTLEAELHRVMRERDILKKALSIFGRDG
jgi:transposase